jgi:hypothetical protein
MIIQFLNFDDKMNLVDEFFVIDSDEQTQIEQLQRDQEKFKQLLQEF